MPLPTPNTGESSSEFMSRCMDSETIVVDLEVESMTTSSYKLVRTSEAGVFAGRVIERRGSEIDMVEARRIWYWSGAASLSELAMRGPANPDICKFAMPVTVTLLGVIEILDVTPKAQMAIDAVQEWTAHE